MEPKSIEFKGDLYPKKLTEIPNTPLKYSMIEVTDSHQSLNYVHDVQVHKRDSKEAYSFLIESHLHNYIELDFRAGTKTFYFPDFT